MDFEEEGEEADTEDQQDEKTSSVSLQQEVKDLSAKLNQVLGAVAKLTKSGERLALCVGEADINFEHDPQFRHLSHQWNQAFERALREGSKSLKPTDRHKVNVLSCVARAILLLQSRAKVFS